MKDGKLFSMAEIAQQTGYSYYSVSTKLKAEGIKPKEFSVNPRLGLYDFDTLPEKFKSVWKNKTDEPEKEAGKTIFKSEFEKEDQARADDKKPDDEAAGNDEGDTSGDQAAADDEDLENFIEAEGLAVRHMPGFITAELIQHFINLFDDDGARNILTIDYGLHPYGNVPPEVREE